MAFVVDNPLFLYNVIFRHPPSRSHQSSFLSYTSQQAEVTACVF